MAEAERVAYGPRLGRRSWRTVREVATSTSCEPNAILVSPERGSG